MSQAKLMTVTELSKLIGNIGKQKVRLESAVQVAAVECIGQSIVHRNVTPAISLFEACEGALRRDALVAFFEKFGNIAFLKSAKKGEPKLGFYEVHKPEAWTEDFVEQVNAMKWMAAKREAEPVSKYDMEREAAKFIERMRKLAADTGKQVEHRDLIDELYAVYAKYVATRTLKEAKVDDSLINQPASPVAAEVIREAAKPATNDDVAALAAHFGKPLVQAA